MLGCALPTVPSYQLRRRWSASAVAAKEHRDGARCPTQKLPKANESPAASIRKTIIQAAWTRRQHCSSRSTGSLGDGYEFFSRHAASDALMGDRSEAVRHLFRPAAAQPAEATAGRWRFGFSLRVPTRFCKNRVPGPKIADRTPALDRLHRTRRGAGRGTGAPSSCAPI